MPMNVTKFHSRQNYCLHCAIWRKDTSPYISICWHYKCARAPALSAGRTHVFISIVRYFMGFARPCTSARKLVCNWRQESLHCWRDKARLPFVLFNRKMVKEIAYLQRTHSNRVGKEGSSHSNWYWFWWYVLTLHQRTSLWKDVCHKLAAHTQFGPMTTLAPHSLWPQAYFGSNNTLARKYFAKQLQPNKLLPEDQIFKSIVFNHFVPSIGLRCASGWNWSHKDQHFQSRSIF